MVHVTEGFAHIGEKEAVTCLTLEALGQAATNEKTVAIGMAKGSFRICSQVDTLESATANLSFFLT